MHKGFFATFGALALVSFSLLGCSQPVKPDGFIDKSGRVVVDPNKVTQKPLAFGDYSEALVPVKFANGYGCLDKEGGIAFARPFRYIAPFSEGIAAYCIGKSAEEGMWGYINHGGETLIEPTYGAAGTFSDGLAPVRMHKDDKGAKFPGKWCYIDKTGKVAIDKYFELAEPFSQGVAAVKDHGKMGCINKTGKFVVPPNYDMVYAANGGIIVAAQGDGISDDNRDQSLDFFDLQGTSLVHKVMTPVVLKNLRHRIWIENEFKVGDLAAAAERKVERPMCTDIGPGFRNGFSIMQDGKKFCHMDPRFQRPGFGHVFDYVFPFSEGMAIVYDDNLGGKLGFIDSTHQLMIPFKFWDASPFSDGVALVQETKGGLYGYIDKKGKYVLPPIYENARPFKDDRALVGPSALEVAQP
jgi:hypothetical protein